MTAPNHHDRRGEYSADELLSWLRQQRAHYKSPRTITFEAHLPRADAGKLYKQQLIDKYSGP